jgi:phosphoribosylpyrophosphate synthetase
MDHLYASPVLIRQLKKNGLENVTFAAPDVGGAKLLVPMQSVSVAI